MKKGSKFERWEMNDKEREYIDKVAREYLRLVSKTHNPDRKERQIVVKEKTKDIITAYQNYDLLDYLGTQMVDKLGKDNEAHKDFLYDLIDAIFELKKHYSPIINELTGMTDEEIQKKVRENNLIKYKPKQNGKDND